MTTIVETPEQVAHRLYAGWQLWIVERGLEFERCRGLSASDTAERLRLLDNKHGCWAHLLIGSESMPSYVPLSDAEMRSHRALIAAGRRGL